MAISEKPWDGSASRWDTPEAYCSACLVDDNPPGQPKKKSLCMEPVKEPGGALSRAGVHAAAARLNQTKTSPANKKKAARKLLGYYRQLNETPPDSLKALAS